MEVAIVIDLASPTTMLWKPFPWGHLYRRLRGLVGWGGGFVRGVFFPLRALPGSKPRRSNSQRKRERSWPAMLDGMFDISVR